MKCCAKEMMCAGDTGVLYRMLYSSGEYGGRKARATRTSETKEILCGRVGSKTSAAGRPGNSIVPLVIVLVVSIVAVFGDAVLSCSSCYEGPLKAADVVHHVASIIGRRL